MRKLTNKAIANIFRKFADKIESNTCEEKDIEEYYRDMTRGSGHNRARDFEDDDEYRDMARGRGVMGRGRVRY